MASEELAKKLQRRLAAEQAATAEPAPAPADPTPAEAPPPPPAKGTETPPETERAAAASDNTTNTNANTNPASSELDAKLTRRLDINDGIAAPKRCKVFNPYTEFKEFSRKQIKEMEAMFKRQVATQHNTTVVVLMLMSCYMAMFSPRVSSSQGPAAVRSCVVLFVWSSVGLGLHCDADR